MSRKIIKRGREFITIFLVIVVVLSPVVASTTIGATTAESGTGDETFTAGNDETITVGDVSVWGESILPLRTVTENADTKIDNAAWYVDHEEIGVDTLLNKSTIGVYSPSTEITIQYTGGDKTSPGELAHDEVHFIAARVEPNTDVNTPSVTSYKDAIELLEANADSKSDLSEEEVEEQINENVTFVKSTQKSLDNTGHQKFSFEPSQSGEYVFFVAHGNKDNSGLSVADGDISLTGEPTIIGVEHAMVHDESSSVELTNTRDGIPARGDTLSFNIDDELEGENVEHAVLVYDEETGYQDQRFELSISGTPSSISELTSQTTFKHSIDDIRGVARIEEGTTLLGEEIGGSEEGISPTVTDIMAFVAENTNREIPDNESIDAPGNGRLDASITAVEGNEPTIDVETYTNWTSSEYRWVHVAVNENGEVRTSTDTFELGKSWFDVSNANLNKNSIRAGKSITATADVENLGNVEKERPVTLYAKRTDADEWSTLTSKDISLVGGESTSVSLTGTIKKAGTYDIKVNGEAAGTVIVKKKKSDDEDPPASGGGGGGGIEPPSTIIENSQQSDGSVLSDIRNGKAGDTVRVSVPSEQATRVSGVTFDGVNINLKNDNAHFELSINSNSERPSTVSSDPADVSVKSYLQIDKNLITNDDIDSATIDFRLSPDQISEDSSPENVVLQRYHDGSWEELETTYTGEENGQHVFEATTPGFSVFAITEKQPDMSVTSASLERSSVSVGETVEVTAEVTNDGNGQGTYTAELIVDGEVVDTKAVTVGAGETTTVTFSYEASETGNRSIAIGDTSAGTLTVTDDDDGSSDEETSEEPTTTTATEPGDGTDDGIGGSLIAFLVLILLGSAGGALYYFRDEVEDALEPYRET